MPMKQSVLAKSQSASNQ